MRHGSINNRWNSGFTVVELVVSATLMVAVMTFVTTMLVRVDQTWKEIGYQRVAIHELSNHLDHLTTLNPQQVDAVIDAIEPSEQVKRTLASPKLSAQRIDDDLGSRVVLTLNWNRRHPGSPVQLVGWLSAEEQ